MLVLWEPPGQGTMSLQCDGPEALPPLGVTGGSLNAELWGTVSTGCEGIPHTHWE